MEPILSRHFHYHRPLALRGYRAIGGYRSLEAAFAHKPEELIQIVENANLRGRGGAGFPCGVKWRYRGIDAPTPRYLVCNLDESEPGTFKDRYLLYRDPHQLVEAVIVSAYALQTERAFIFVRGEYAEGARGLEAAVAEAEEAGLIGKNILGSGFDLRVEVHLSAGRYICGEETALLNALEGRRANPRHKPPHPGQKGLWGQPTTVNNAETLANVPHILVHGADWFKNLGINGGSGPKLYGVCGPVQKPGLFERPMGTTARELIFGDSGGLIKGRKLAAFLPGGSSTPFLFPEHLDVPMNFDALSKLGSRLGTGSIIVLDDATCPVAFTISLMRFYERESCGFCTPCRDGLPFVTRLLERIEAGMARLADLDLLEELCHKISPNTFCAFAPGAIMPVLSSLHGFRDCFAQHSREQSCPFQRGEGH